jgi:hypothetical protein
VSMAARYRVHHLRRAGCQPGGVVAERQRRVVPGWLPAPPPGDPTAARARLLGGVAEAVAARTGTRLPDLALLSAWGAPVPVPVPAQAADPWLLGVLHEALLGRAARRRSGVFHTPRPVAEQVVGWALEGVGDEPRVCDPAVGGGVFLLAAAEALSARGVAPARVVGRALVGADVDPVAAAVAQAALSLWCGGAAVPEVVVGDALLRADEEWSGPFDAVVTNPPFLGQMQRGTARSPETATALRRRFGPAATGYADTAVLFLLLGHRLARRGGRVAMVLPRSFLATRHAGRVRRAVLDDAALERLWLPDEGTFDASVSVCVPVLRRGGEGRSGVVVERGSPPVPSPPLEVDHGRLAAAPTWSHLLAAADGPPPLPALDGPTLGSACSVAADFRDQYYGMGPYVVDDLERHLDDERFPPLVTSGLIDPAATRWGRRDVRYLRRRWSAPRVDLARLRDEGGLGRWADARLVPKVLLATQTRVLEAAVDERGRWLPSTPVLTVVTTAERLWHTAAVLLSPVATAWAVRTCGGAGMAPGAIKLAAAQVRAIPLPGDGGAWDEAAVAVHRASTAGCDDVRRAALLEAADASTAAYGVADGAGLVAWWEERLPTAA